MIQIRYYCNFNERIIGEEPGGRAFVYQRNGQTKTVPWLGIIDVEIAKRLPGAKPVKVDASYYSMNRATWTRVPKDQCLQGCLIRAGVYGVTVDGRFRLVPKPDFCAS